MKILVVGDWQNALVTAACLACIDHQVTLAPIKGFHLSPTSIPKLDIDEPGLDGLVAEGVASGRLVTMTEPMLNFDAVWIAADTVSGPDGYPDVAPVLEAADRFLGAAPLFVVSSQVPIGTCRAMMARMPRTQIVYVPENMRLGDGVRTFLHASRIVIGAEYVAACSIVEEMLNVPEGPERRDQPCVGGHVIRTDLSTAEMIKHATNAWLAMNISFANELSELGKPFDVDMAAVTEALRADSRIGHRAPLVAGDGYGGTLARDVAVLARMPGASLIKTVQAVNNARVARSRELAIWKKEREV